MDSAAGLGSRLGLSRRYPGSHRAAITRRMCPASSLSSSRIRSVLWNFEGEREWLRRRRSISQPSEKAVGNRSVRRVGEKVARNELPWVLDENAANSEGVEEVCAVRESTPPALRSSTRFGVGRVSCWSFPRVASQARQPWAGLLNAFGIIRTARAQNSECVRRSKQILTRRRR